jgi:phosphoglycerate dehydrogenase-like enzyme
VLHIYHGDGARVREVIGAKQPDRNVVVWADEHALRAGIGEAQVLFASSPPRGLWRGARRLRLIQLMGVGADDLLPAPDLPAEVAVTCLRGVFAAEVSEAVFAMVLALLRGMPALVTRQQRREWRPFASGTLAGKTVGILGYGAVGQRVARAAEAFGMRVLSFSRSAGTLDEVVRESHVLVVCLPRTPQTEGLVDSRVIALLPPGAFVVNVARGGIVDEQALLEALARGDVGGVALDVFDQEPLPPSSPWWTAPNTIVTPHVAGFGLGYVERAVDILLENVRRLEAGEELIHRVDRTSGY